jgi:hypothetical protein
MALLTTSNPIGKKKVMAHIYHIIITPLMQSSHFSELCPLEMFKKHEHILVSTLANNLIKIPYLFSFPDCHVTGSRLYAGDSMLPFNGNVIGGYESIKI